MARRSLAAVAAALAALAAAAHAAAPVTLAVVRCPTSLGVKQPLPAVPKSLRLALPAGVGALLAGYSNGYLTALGPRGWRCRGQIGADGSGVLDVTPGRSGPVKQPAITVQFADTPGVSADIACSLFASARAQLPVQPCPVKHPAREALVALTHATIAFEDPPGVHGIGVPSGGSDPADGVATFVPSTASTTGYALIETCTLAARSHALCTAILDNIFKAGSAPG